MVAILRLLLSVLLLSCMAAVSLSQGEEEEFSEELMLKPLADRKVLAHFHFQSRAPPTRMYGHHHHLFPKALYQLVQKFRIREMELSFTQGRWNYERWGGFDPISSSNAKPPGVELWTVFDVPHDQVDASWKNLTHTLSGLFCASINFLESSTAYSAPDWGFQPFSGSLRYGSLPREAVCTENLTPWLKLLPCRDKTGLAALMDRPSIYRGFYHSQRLRLTSTEFGSTEVESGIAVDQTLTVVLQPTTSRRASMTYSGDSAPQPSWSLSSIFGRKVSGRCVLAKSSNVYIQVERGLMSKLKNLHAEDEGSGAGDIPFEKSWNNSGFELSIAPNRVIKEVNSLHDEAPTVLYEYVIDNYSTSEPFDLGFTWNLPVVWSSPQAPLRASRFLMGSGNERGAIAISLKATEASDGLWGADTTENSCMLRFNVFQVVPWYIKVYFHTLQVFVDGKPQSFMDVIERMRVSPSEDKVSPGLMEMAFKLPCHVKSVIFTLEFDKGFLHIDEYPPDANQGFDIPSAVISFPDFHASMHFLKDDSLNKSPVLSKFQERSPVLCYTEVLLVPLTTPDFSMPYNVITITCTVFALYFGTLLNVLRRRVDEEERLLKRKDSKTGRLRQLLSKLFAKLRGKSWEPTETQSASSSLNSFKLFLVILVAGIAVGCQYYFQ